MSLNFIAVEGCSLEFQDGGSPNSAITINPNQVSTKVKADGKGVYKTLKFTILGYTASSAKKQYWVAGSGSGSGEINASSQNVKVEGNSVILEGDESSTITISGMEQLPGSTNPTPTTTTDFVKVTKAGQSKVKGA